MLQQSEIQNFLKYMQDNRSASTHTIDAYTRTLNFATTFIEEENINNTRRFDISPYRLQIVKLAPKSIAQKVSALRSFFEYLKLCGNKVFVVGDDQIKTPKTLPKPANQKSIEEILKNADIEQRLLIILMYGLGLRFSEATSITLKNISDEWIKVIGKGNKAREIYILPKIKEEIDSYIKINAPKVYLFEEENRPLSPSVLRYRLMKSIEKLSDKRFTPHQLRHSFATLLLNSGARINDVSELLGHAQLSTTKIYTQLAASTKLKDYTKAHPLCRVN